MISHKHKFIFVHISKTGGSSIERALNPDIKLDSSPRTKNTGNTVLKEKHWYVDRYQQEYKKQFDEYFKFTIVRNPWDREVSRWKWRGLALNENHSFKKHLEHAFVDNYSQWICNNDQYLMDYIGRFENLQQDFNIICDKIGVEHKQLPHANKTNHEHYTEYYDDETRDIVARRYAKDIEYFGYMFDDQ